MKSNREKAQQFLNNIDAMGENPSIKDLQEIIDLVYPVKVERKYTFDEYKKMATKFNKMSFYYKIKAIKENNNILCLASDGNWWQVLAKDREMQEKLYDNDISFVIESEWDSGEMCDMICLLGIDNVDL